MHIMDRESAENQGYSVADQFGRADPPARGDSGPLPGESAGLSATGGDAGGGSPRESIRRKFTPDKFLTTIDPVRIVRGLPRHRTLGMAIMLVAMVLAAASHFIFRGKSYSATARMLYVAEEGENKVSGWDSISSFRLQPFSRSTVVGMLQYPEMLATVTNRLDLDIGLGSMAERLVVGNPSDSEIIMLDYYHDGSGREAVDIVNAVAEAAIEYNQQLYLKQAQSSYEELKRRVDIVSEEVEASKRAIEEFKSSNRSLDISLEHQAYLADLSEISYRLSDAKMRNRSLQVQIENYADQIEEMPEEVISESYANSPLKRKMANLSMTLLAARTRYKADNPKVVKLEREMAELRRAVGSGTDVEREEIYTPNPLREAMEGELVRRRIDKKASEEAVARLESELEEMRARFEGMPRKEVEYASLLQRRKSAQQIFTSLNSSLEHAKVALGSDLADFEIITRASEPKVYTSRAGMVLPLLIAVAGFFGAIAVVVFVELCDPYLRTAREMETAYAVPCLSAIPFMSDLDHSNTHERLMRYLREIGTRLSSLGMLRNNSVLALFSVCDGTGKSTLAFNLARYYAKLGRKVVYLDFDHRPNTELPCGDDLVSIGLVAYLISSHDAAQLISSHCGVDFMKCETLREDMPELMQSQSMARLFDYLQREYELVFLEAPAVGNLRGALELARYADHRIILLDSSTTRKTEFNKAIDALESGGFSIRATMLNKVEPIYISKK